MLRNGAEDDEDEEEEEGGSPPVTWGGWMPLNVQLDEHR